MLEFDSYRIGVKGQGLRGETPKVGGLTYLGPSLLRGYLPPILPLSG